MIVLKLKMRENLNLGDQVKIGVLDKIGFVQVLLNFIHTFMTCG